MDHPRDYVREIFGQMPLSNDLLSAIDRLQVEQKINVNRALDGSNTIRDHGLIMRVVIFLGGIYISLRRRYKVLEKISDPLRSLYILLFRWFGAMQKIGEVSVNDNLLLQLSKSYAHSNAKLQAVVRSDLKKYGYKID